MTRLGLQKTKVMERGSHLRIYIYILLLLVGKYLPHATHTGKTRKNPFAVFFYFDYIVKFMISYLVVVLKSNLCQFFHRLFRQGLETDHVHAN